MSFVTCPRAAAARASAAGHVGDPSTWKRIPVPVSMKSWTQVAPAIPKLTRSCARRSRSMRSSGQE
eukprot:2859132-Pyramimonas_sp.AAC.1